MATDRASRHESPRSGARCSASTTCRGTDHFFERGGHSLLATKAIVRLRDAFRLKLPLALLFEYPVLRELATAIEARVRDASEPAPASGRRGPSHAAAPLSSAQQRLWFLDQLDPGSAAYNVPGAVHLEGDLDASALDRRVRGHRAPARGAAHHVRDRCRDSRVQTRGGRWAGSRFDRVDLRHVAGPEERPDARRPVGWRTTKPLRRSTWRADHCYADG